MTFFGYPKMDRVPSRFAGSHPGSRYRILHSAASVPRCRVASQDAATQNLADLSAHRVKRLLPHLAALTCFDVAKGTTVRAPIARTTARTPAPVHISRNYANLGSRTVAETAIQQVKGGVIPGVTSEVTSEVSRKLISRLILGFRTGFNSGFRPEVTSGVSPEVSSEFTSKLTAGFSSEFNPKVRSGFNSEVSFRFSSGFSCGFRCRAPVSAPVAATVVRVEG